MGCKKKKVKCRKKQSPPNFIMLLAQTLSHFLLATNPIHAPISAKDRPPRAGQIPDHPSISREETRSGDVRTLVRRCCLRRGFPELMLPELELRWCCSGNLKPHLRSALILGLNQCVVNWVCSVMWFWMCSVPAKNCIYFTEDKKTKLWRILFYFFIKFC